MDPLEFHAKYNRLERKHRRVEKELAELKAEMEKNRAAPMSEYSISPVQVQARAYKEGYGRGIEGSG